MLLSTKLVFAISLHKIQRSYPNQYLVFSIFQQLYNFVKSGIKLTPIARLRLFMSSLQSVIKHFKLLILTAILFSVTIVLYVRALNYHKLLNKRVDPTGPCC